MNPLQSILSVIEHFLVSHPELAPQVEMIAARVQGKSPEDIINFEEWKRYNNASVKEVFTRIYEEGHWGKSGDPDNPFFSGRGSHAGPIVNGYVDGVRAFLSSLPRKPSALDLGCGDFNVGSQLRAFCSDYIACDIVSPLIEHNKQKFKDLDVDFRVLDLIEDDLPAADVIFIRQVLQHLSNAQIQRVVDKLATRCKYLLVTEHLPKDAGFIPNRDKPAGASIRLNLGSGVVLSAPPFNLKSVSQKVLVDISEGNGLLRTMLYELS